MTPDQRQPGETCDSTESPVDNLENRIKKAKGLIERVDFALNETGLDEQHELRIEDEDGYFWVISRATIDLEDELYIDADFFEEDLEQEPELEIYLSISHDKPPRDAIDVYFKTEDEDHLADDEIISRISGFLDNLGIPTLEQIHDQKYDHPGIA